MIETLRNAVWVLFATALVEVCEVVDENLARWAKRGVAKQRGKQRTRTRRGSHPEAGS
jgi:hypothetical protein